MTPIQRLFHDEVGATTVEYAVLLALILGACIAAITSVGGGTGNYWLNNQQELDNALGSAS